MSNLARSIKVGGVGRLVRRPILRPLPFISLLIFCILLLASFPIRGLDDINFHDYDSFSFRVTGSSKVAGTPFVFAPASYGNSIINPPGQLFKPLRILRAWPDTRACTDLRNPATGKAQSFDGTPIEGSLLLIKRGGCTFGQKSTMAELAGAAAALIYACGPEPPDLCVGARVDMYAGEATPNITTIMIKNWDGDKLDQFLRSTCPESQTQTPITVHVPDMQIHTNDSMSPFPSSSFFPSSPPGDTGGLAFCNLTAWLPGTSAIAMEDRAALTRMSQDFLFEDMDPLIDRFGPYLAPFTAIQDPNHDPCLVRTAGIWCEGSPGRIVQLNLDSMNLSGVLSPSIGDLTALRTLVLNSNNFWCVNLPCEFGRLSALRVLSLFHMSLISFHPPAPANESCLDGLVNLQMVDARFNKLQGLSASIPKWRSLRALALDNSEIDVELYPETFEALTSTLEYLSLKNNRFRMDVSKMRFKAQSPISVLRMDANQFYGEFRPDTFDQLHALMVVDFCLNNIHGRLPDFRWSAAVSYVDFSSNQLEGNVSNWVMKQLTYLSLANNQISEPQENIPTNMWALEFLDLSYNRLTIDPNKYSGVGQWLMELMPNSLQTLHLEHNELSGPWTTGSVISTSQLKNFFIAHNDLHNIPTDIFSIGGGSIVNMDISHNQLIGELPPLPPGTSTVSLKFNGNANFRSTTGQLPAWIEIDEKGNWYQPPNASYQCPSLVGTLTHLSVQLDPEYYDYIGCECVRGTYGKPPDCPDIPSLHAEPPSTGPRTHDGLPLPGARGSFSDEVYGNNRFFVGMDTSWILGTTNVTDESSGPGEAKSTPSQQQQVHVPSPVTDPMTGDPVRVIYISIDVNRSVFDCPDDQIAVYAGGMDLRGARVILWRGSDDTFPVNIDLHGRYPPNTITLLSNHGVLQFRSRHSSGKHFQANFTFSSDCPPAYEVDGSGMSCVLPPPSSMSLSIILLLVCCVVIGILSLCLVGQKMSLIQSLINGSSLHHRNGNSQGRDEDVAEELFGPVLSVEESWRRRLRRDLAKETFLLLLELAGYASNWIVVLVQLKEHVGPILDDGFLLGYMAITVISTVTAWVSVFTRVRVMKEIHRELTVGLAVVPTIDMVLNRHKRIKQEHEHKKEQAEEDSASSAAVHPLPSSPSSVWNALTKRFRKNPSVVASTNVDESMTSGDYAMLNEIGDSSINSNSNGPNSSSHKASPHRRHSAFKVTSCLSSLSRPLLPDGDGDAVTLDDSMEASQRADHASRQDRTRTESGSVGTGAGHSFNSTVSLPFPQSDGSMEHSGNSDSSEPGMKVRLSSKDPNVQLAAVQRTLSSTKLTSFNLIFNTIPFLILNQIRLFGDDSLRRDWALQVSSLVAAMLLGVKAVRILAMSEMKQRRNELVFDVITRKSMNGLNIKGGGGGGMGRGSASSYHPYKQRHHAATDAYKRRHHHPSYHQNPTATGAVSGSRGSIGGHHLTVPPELTGGTSGGAVSTPRADPTDASPSPAPAASSMIGQSFPHSLRYGTSGDIRSGSSGAPSSGGMHDMDVDFDHSIDESSFDPHPDSLLLAPATSFASARSGRSGSNASGSYMRSASTHQHLSADPASFDRDDSTIRWAAANQGSTLIPLPEEELQAHEPFSPYAVVSAHSQQSRVVLPELGQSLSVTSAAEQDGDGHEHQHRESDAAVTATVETQQTF